MKKYIKKWLFGKETREVLGRMLLLCVLAVIFHFLFLGAGQQTMRKQIFSWMRLVCFLGVLWQCFYLGEEKGPVEKLKGILFRAMLFVGNGIGRVFDFFFKMTQSTRARKGAEEIRGYQDEVNSIAGRVIRKWRRPKYKKWKNMNNQEKIRYLYYKSVSRHSKKDMEFTYQKTAWEIYDELKEKNKLKDAEPELFRLYNIVRYRDKSSDISVSSGNHAHMNAQLKLDMSRAITHIEGKLKKVRDKA